MYTTSSTQQVHVDDVKRLTTPNLLRHLDNQPELGSLVLHRQLIAEHGAGKAALWTDTELVERNVLACLVDAALQIIGAFQLAGLGGNQSQVQPLSARQIAERRKITGPRRVELQEVAIDFQLVEQYFGDRIVTAFRHPGAGEVTATKMRADLHRGRTIFDAIIVKLRIDHGQCIWVLADFTHVKRREDQMPSALHPR